MIKLSCATFSTQGVDFFLRLGFSQADYVIIMYDL